MALFEENQRKNGCHVDQRNKLAEDNKLAMDTLESANRLAETTLKDDNEAALKRLKEENEGAEEVLRLANVADKAAVAASKTNVMNDLEQKQSDELKKMRDDHELEKTNLKQ